MSRNWGLPPTWLRFLIAILLGMGIFFRIVNLDGKFYWFDEVYTSFRVSGYTAAEFYPNVYNGSVKSREELQQYQQVNAEKGVIDTIKGLAIEEPQLPPLYFILARFWSKIFGNSVAAMRSLPALISLLVFPCIYWLCLELFQFPLVAWMAMAIAAISPFHVLYAQEARPYSLWTVTILLSSAALLRAIRVQTQWCWGIYALTLVLGIYTFLYSILVTIAHGVYVIAIEGWRWSKTVKSYLIAAAIGFLSLGLWVALVLYWQQSAIPYTSPTLTTKISRLALLARWIGNFSRVFLDFNLDVRTPLGELLPVLPFIFILLGVAAYGIYFVCRHTPKRTWLFIITLMGVTTLPLMGVDLIKGWMRLSGVPRYLLPWYLAAQISIAYLLTLQIIAVPVQLWKQKMWYAITVLVFSAGVFSCVLSSQAQTWWNKGLEQGEIIIPASHIINQAKTPLFISDDQFAGVFPFLYLLDNRVKFQLSQGGKIGKIPEGFSDVFLFRPSKKLRSKLTTEYHYQIEWIEVPGKTKDQIFGKLHPK